MDSSALTQSQREDRLLRNTLFVFFVSGACAQPLGSFIPFLRQAYGFSYDLSGVLLSCQSVGNFIAVLATGFLPAWLGRRRSILVTASWMAVGYRIFASGLSRPALLAPACFMIGIARGSNANFSNTMVSTLPPEKSARGYDLLHGAFAAGALLSPLLLVAGASRWPQNGWRVVAAGLCLLAVAQVAVYARMGLPPEPAGKGAAALDYSFLRVKGFWLAAAIFFFYICAEYAIMGWLVTYLQDAGILSDSLAQVMNSLLWLVIFAGRMVGAAISGKLSRGRLLLCDGVGLFAFFLLMFFSRSPGPAVAGLMGMGFCMSTIYPTTLALGTDAIRGNSLGCGAILFAGSVGGVVSPVLVGLVAERFDDIRAGMGLLVVYTALLLLSIVLSVALLARSQADQEKERM